MCVSEQEHTPFMEILSTVRLFQAENPALP